MRQISAISRLNSTRCAGASAIFTRQLSIWSPALIGRPSGRPRRLPGPPNRAIRQGPETVQGVIAIVAAIGGMPGQPATLISASACRYYGISDSTRFAEDSPPGPSGDFLTDTTHLWEAEAQRSTDHGLRVVILRFGIALAVTESGRETLKRLRPFLGGRIGSGRQWVSRIHREDAIDILLRALDRGL
ncbi:hypothetical protein ACM26W_03650 [Halomonas sp. HK25]|uniref:hypothetical protein n=1 Tax=Halomonas sp. HK25 TaxID=3394321 RepID=UPI0039FCCFC2